MAPKDWETHNPGGNKRVIVTKKLPGTLWLKRLIEAGCKVEICTSTDVLSVDEIKAAIGTRCDGVLGQLTEDWGDELFAALKAAGIESTSVFREGADPAATISQLAGEVGADVVLLGATRQIFDQSAWESVSARVMIESGRPVLVLPPSRQDVQDPQEEIYEDSK